MAKDTGQHHPQREHRLPARYQDILPEPVPAVAAEENQPPPQILPRVRLTVCDTIQTITNKFGLWREYLHRPSYDPDNALPVADLDHPILGHSEIVLEAADNADDPMPVRNVSVDLLLDWQNSGSNQKSNAEIDSLVEVLRHPDFSVDDLPEWFNAARENHKWDMKEEKSSYLRGFQETSVKLKVPSGDENMASQFVDISGLHFRKLTSIIHAAFTSPLASKFHLSPFKLFHKSPDSGVTECVFSELYNSDAFIKEHDRVQ